MREEGAKKSMMKKMPVMTSFSRGVYGEDGEIACGGWEGWRTGRDGKKGMEERERGGSGRGERGRGEEEGREGGRNELMNECVID